MESNIEYFIDNNIRRCKYKNLYFINGNFEFLTTDKNIQIYPVICHSNSNDYILDPILKIFENEESLKMYIEKNNLENISGITCFFTNYFDSHIGHGIYDTLYPIYHCFLRCGYRKEPFNILYQMGKFLISDKNKEIYKTFSKTNRFLIYEYLLQERNNYIFEVVVSGSYGSGISCANENAMLIGNDINGIKKFRDRMLKVYNINNDSKINNAKKKVIIVDSNRYSIDTKNTLYKINSYLNTTNLYDCNYITWNNIKSFKNQLELVNCVDIYISGPGTGMLNFPFLNDNKRVINIGAENISNVGVFGYIDNTFICHVSQYINCDFYDIIKYKKVLYSELLDLIINNNLPKIIIPNYIKIWRDYCKRDNINIKNIIERMNGKEPHIMAYRVPEIVVQEKGPFEENIKDPQLNLINHKLLQEIKKNYIDY